MTRCDSRPGQATTAQGDVVALWAMWGLFVTAVFATYTRLDPGELYHVSRAGIAGGASRVLVELNYPISLFAIAAVLIAVDALGGGWWWWLGGPAIVACAVTAWPGVVDDADLDARAINVIPAIGVVAAVALTIAATRQAGMAMAPRRSLDPARIAVAAVVLFLSLPWIFGVAGVYIPEFGFIAERPIVGSDGAVSPAVHLGDHHGFNGALFLISALVLSRPRLRSRVLGTMATGYVSLMAAYGAVNFVQDLTNEQLHKREWVGWRIPDAVKPTVTPIWLVILALAVAAFVAFSADARRSEPEAAPP